MMTSKHPVEIHCGDFGTKTVHASLAGDGEEPTPDLIKRYQTLRHEWANVWPIVLDAARSRLTVEEFGVGADELLRDPSTTYELEVYDPGQYDESNWSFTITRMKGSREIVVPLVFHDLDFGGGQVIDRS